MTADGTVSNGDRGVTRIDVGALDGSGVLDAGAGRPQLDRTAASVDLDGLMLAGDVVLRGQVVITPETDLSAVTSLDVIGGEIEVLGDVTLPQLALTNAVLRADGTVTLSDGSRFDSATLAGEGRVVAPQGVEATVSRTVNVGLALDVDGALRLEPDASARLGVGQFFDGAFLSFGGAVEVGETGALVLGPGSGIANARTVPGFDNCVLMAGLLSLDGDAALLVKLHLGDGRLQIAGGVLTQAQVDAGLVAIELQGGGALSLPEDVQLPRLVTTGGRILGDGDLTITRNARFNGVTIGASDAALTIAQGAEAVFDNTPFFGSNSFGRDVTVSGAASVAGGLSLGVRTFVDGRTVSGDGRLTVAETGVLTLSDASFITLSLSEEGDGVVSDGRLVFDGSAQAPLPGGGAGMIEVVAGVLVHSFGALLIDRALIDAGLTRLEVRGGTVEIVEDVALEQLTVTGGSLTGAGDLTVTQRLALQGGNLSGDGALIAAESAATLLGSESFTASVTSSRDIALLGDAEMANARVSLGQGVVDPETGRFETESATLTVGPAATLTVTGFNAGFASARLRRCGRQRGGRRGRHRQDRGRDDHAAAIRRRRPVRCPRRRYRPRRRAGAVFAGSGGPRA